jgi:hypothetical protein
MGIGSYVRTGPNFGIHSRQELDLCMAAPVVYGLYCMRFDGTIMPDWCP